MQMSSEPDNQNSVISFAISVVAPRALVFLPLVKGTKLWERNCRTPCFCIFTANVMHQTSAKEEIKASMDLSDCHAIKNKSKTIRWKKSRNYHLFLNR